MFHIPDPLDRTYDLLLATFDVLVWYCRETRAVHIRCPILPPPGLRAALNRAAWTTPVEDDDPRDVKLVKYGDELVNVRGTPVSLGQARKIAELAARYFETRNNPTRLGA